jgi:hypothetical protein
LDDARIWATALFRHLVIGGGPQLGDLALGGGGQLVGLAPGAGADAVGLALSRAALVVGLALGVGAQLAGLVLSRGAQLGRLDLGCGVELVGGRAGLLDDLSGLLLGEPEQLLNPGAQPGVRRTLLFLELPVCVGKFLLQSLGLVPVLPQIAVNLLQVLVDLMRVITPHDPGEVTLR